MKKKNKRMSGLDLWKFYHLGFYEFDNLSDHDQREILNYDESMRIIVPDLRLKLLYDIYGEQRMKSSEVLLEHLSEYYKVDKDIVSIRISQVIEESKKEEKIKVKKK